MAHSLPPRASSSTPPSLSTLSSLFLTPPFLCRFVLLLLAEVFGWHKTPDALSLLKTSFGSFNRRRDLQAPWMFCWQQVWGLLPFRALTVFSQGDLRVDLIKLLLLESPNTAIPELHGIWCHGQRFELPVGCSDGTMAPSLLSHWTSPIAVILPNYWIAVKTFFFIGFVVVFLCSCVYVLFCFYCGVSLLPPLL